MPQGIGRPYNKDLRTIQNSPLYKGSGLAGEVSKALEEKRKFGARGDFQEMRTREQTSEGRQRTIFDETTNQWKHK